MRRHSHSQTIYRAESVAAVAWEGGGQGAPGEERDLTRAVTHDLGLFTAPSPDTGVRVFARPSRGAESRPDVRELSGPPMVVIEARREWERGGRNGQREEERTEPDRRTEGQTDKQAYNYSRTERKTDSQTDQTDR